MRPGLRRPLWVGGLVVWMGLGCASGGAANSSAFDLDAKRMAAGQGARAAVAQQWAKAQEALGAGRAAEAGQRLAAAWTFVGELHSEAVVAGAIGGLAETAVPRRLLRIAAVHKARIRFAAGDDQGAISLAAAHTDAPEPVGSRAALVAGLAAMSSGKVTIGLAWLTRARASSEQPLADLAATTVGAAHLDGGRLREAIEALTSVPNGSPYFERARVALAWCHYRAGRAPAAWRVLKRLDGGPWVTPSRGVIAALAAHADGRGQEAWRGVSAILARREVWLSAPGSTLVLAAVAADPTTVRASPARRIALDPGIGGLAKELLSARRDAAAATGELGLALGGYSAALKARLDVAVAAAGRRGRAENAALWAELEALHKQLPKP